jgi:pimeloyl-ACP methyl ester carboxylesterase
LQKYRYAAGAVHRREYEGVRRERRDFAWTNPEMMEPSVPNLRKSVILAKCGHWAQQERPAEVNAEIISFLNGLA